MTVSLLQVRKLTQLVLLAHSINKVTRAHTLVVCLGELLSSAIKRTTEAGTDCEQTSNKGGDQILASTSCDDCVHGTRHGRTVIGSQHEHHLQELASVVGQSAPEPQQGHDTTNSDLLLEHVRDWRPA